MTLKEFNAEISTTFSSYSETGDIDFISVKGWVIDCLRKFGKNICEKREAIVEVKNSQAKLPETFKSLILALDLTPAGYKIHGDVEKAKDSFIYRERIEQSGYYDFSSHTFTSSCEKAKIITESIVCNNQPCDLYYSPNYLSVVKGFKKDSFDVDCINLHPSIREAYPNQISINKSTLQANYKEGRIYLQYWGLPLGEDEEVEIPEITTGDILLFITNHIKIQIAENLILNNKNPNPGLGALLQNWQQQVISLRNAAKSEANWNGISKNFAKDYNRMLQIEASKYNLPRF